MPASSPKWDWIVHPQWGFFQVAIMLLSTCRMWTVSSLALSIQDTEISIALPSSLTDSTPQEYRFVHKNSSNRQIYDSEYKPSQTQYKI